MIKSKFKYNAVPAFWIVIGTTIILLAVEIYYLYDHFTHIQPAIPGKVMISLVIILGCLLYFSFWLKTVATIIEINTDGRTITFTNYFTQQTKTYSFYDFDGYLQTVDVNSKTRSEYKVLCLMKDKVIVRKLSASYYSNIEELEKGLKPINYLGFETFGMGKKLKILCKQPVLD